MSFLSKFLSKKDSTEELFEQIRKIRENNQVKVSTRTYDSETEPNFKLRKRKNGIKLNNMEVVDARLTN